MTEEFEKVIELVKKNIDIFSEKDKAFLYKYYKQATIGDINIDKPAFIYYKEKQKWNEWNSVKGVSKSDAMKEYIKFVNSNDKIKK